MAKSASRPKRWAEAVSEARTAIESANAAWDEVKAKLETLKEVQSEYGEWKDNLPDSLANGALGEKLEAVCELDFDPSDLDEAEAVIDEAEEIELPLGFGRD